MWIHWVGRLIGTSVGKIYETWGYGMIYLSVITRNILQQNVLVFCLWARYLYHGQEIGLLDDMSCHLALILSGY